MYGSRETFVSVDNRASATGRHFFGVVDNCNNVRRKEAYVGSMRVTGANEHCL
jgi:hypothetical protein